MTLADHLCGKARQEPLLEALLREDGRILYPVEDGIPVMLIEESVDLSETGA